MVNEMCKVCQFYDYKGYCRKGWKKYCEGEDFIPSEKWTLYRALEDMMNEGYDTTGFQKYWNDKFDTDADFEL